MANLRRDLRLLTALGVAGTLLLAVVTRSGLTFSPDSVEYLSVAQHLLEGKGVYTAASITLSSFKDASATAWVEASPFVQYAPLYSVLIALVSKVTQIDLVTSAWYIALIGGAVFLVASAWLVRSCSLFRPLTLFGWLLLLLAPSFWANYTMLLSETLFLPLSVIFLMTLNRYLLQPRFGWLALASLLAAAASLTRYNGLVTIAVGAIFLLLQRTLPLLHRVRHVLFFTLVSALPLIGWLGRNWYVSGTLLGERGSSRLSALEALSYTTLEIWSWFLPFRSQAVQPELRVALLFVFAVFLALYVVLRWRYASVVGAGEPFRRVTRMSDIAASFFTLQVGSVVVSEIMAGIDWPNRRLLAPAWVPFLCVLLWSASALWSAVGSSFTSRRRRLLLGVVLGLVVTVVVTNAVGRSLRTVVVRQRALHEYRALCTKIRETYANCVPSEHAVLVSNDATTVHYALGKPIVLSPRKYYYNSWDRVVPSEVETLLRLAGSGRETVLIWVHDAPYHGHLYPFDELSSLVALKPLCESEDIGIYSVLPPRQAGNRLR